MDIFPPVKPTILVVDDSPANITILGGVLSDEYLVRAVNHGAKALKAASQSQPDLILLDILMPDINGYEVCRQLKAHKFTQHIPIIFLTSNTELKTEEVGMSLGAVDFITRPINPEILLSRVKSHLVNAAQARTMRVNNEYLEFEVSKRVRELEIMQQVTILALASLAEVRDQDTGRHLRRTQNYVRSLAKQLHHHPRFLNFVTDSVISMLYECAPLHDIGKVGIPDRVLLKPGRFDACEFAIMKTHPTLGYEALLRAQEVAGESLEFLEIAKQIVYAHHEKWDGTGYPLKLAGDNIPIPARLMALADVYDALTSDRVYKVGISHEQAKAIIVEGRGKHFDPDVVDAFLEISDEFEAIAKRFADSPDDLREKAEYLTTITGAEFGKP